MDRAEFWTLVEEASRDGADEATRDARLVDRLKPRSVQELADFARILDELREEVDSWRMWGAATIISGGWCSDDGFFYFQMWLLSLGRETFSLVREEPDALATVPRIQYLAAKGYRHWDDDDRPRWEGLDFVADNAQEAQGAGDGPSIDELVEESGYSMSSAPDPADEPFDMADSALMSARYPRLWRLFHPDATATAS